MLRKFGGLLVACVVSASVHAAVLAPAAMEGAARDVSSGEVIYKLRMLASADEQGISQYGVVCEATDGRLIARADYFLDSASGKFTGASWRYSADASRLELQRADKRWVARSTGEAQRERVSYPKLRSSDVFGWALADVLRQNLAAIQNAQLKELSFVFFPDLRRQSFRLNAHTFWQAHREMQLVQLSPKAWFSDGKQQMSFEFSLPDGKLRRYTGPSMCSADPDTAAKVEIRF